MTTNNIRPVEQVITAHRQREGGGFIVRRPFPAGLPDGRPVPAARRDGPGRLRPGEAVGAPDHPHRGFETVTYMLEGRGAHEDSRGPPRGHRPGDVQWMTAGAGVVHSETPSQQLLERAGACTASSCG
jgi:redox-sensitive bicupin YhaK (pirin superfamily)